MIFSEPRFKGKFIGNLQYFEKEFIEHNIKQRDGLREDLYEKSLNSLEYLAQLIEAGMDPIFKGGSAVQLLTPNDLQRISIDIDLAVDTSETEIINFLNAIYNKFERQLYAFEPHKGVIPHFFRIFHVETPSLLSINKSTIELDILLHKPKYEIQEILLKTFLYDSNIKIKIPTANSLIGDKLTVLAPNTIGKKLREPLQYSKQLYDLSILLNLSNSFSAIYEAYVDVFEFEKVTHNLTSITLNEVINDLIYVCKLYSLAAYTPNALIDPLIKEHIRFIQRGIENLQPYVSRKLKLTSYRSRAVASKIAFLGKLIELNHQDQLITPVSMHIFHDDLPHIKELSADPSYIKKCTNQLNLMDKREFFHIDSKEFKKADPLGFIYWYGYYYPFDFLDDVK
jgi:hypothetical protein